MSCEGYIFTIIYRAHLGVWDGLSTRFDFFIYVYFCVVSWLDQYVPPFFLLDQYGKAVMRLVCINKSLRENLDTGEN